MGGQGVPVYGGRGGLGRNRRSAPQTRKTTNESETNESSESENTAPAQTRKCNLKSNAIIPHERTDAGIAGHLNPVARRGFRRLGRWRQPRKPWRLAASIQPLWKELWRLGRGVVEVGLFHPRR